MGETGSVGRVNDVVSKAGMIGVAGEQRIEDGDGPPLLSEGGIGPRRGRELAQRIVDRDLDVPRELAIEPRQGVGVRLKSRWVGGGLGVAVERSRRGNEPA